MVYTVIGCSKCGHRTRVEGEGVAFIEEGKTYEFADEVCPNTDCNKVGGSFFVDFIRDDGFDGDVD